LIPFSQFDRAPVCTLLAAIAMLSIGACDLGAADSTTAAEGGAGNAPGGMVVPDDPGGGFVLEDVVAPRPDTTTSDGIQTPADASPGPDVAADPGFKADNVYWVPGGVAARGQVAAGAGAVAWVERDAPGGIPRLVLWRVTELEPPLVLRIPHLANPGQLALSADWLVYVDDRYGDPDIFAVDLRTGYEEAVATDIGPQVEPTVRGSLVAWRDCRTCVDGAHTAAEIYQRDLDSDDPEQRVTDSPEDDRSPALGYMGDGSGAIAWIAGERRLRVRAAGLDQAWEVGTFVSTVDVTAGRLTWRERTGVVNPDSMKPVGVVNPDSMMPVSVVNPDSMIPSDVFGTNALTGQTDALSVHAELSPELEGAVHAAGGRVAWVESTLDLDVPTRLVVADAGTGKVAVAVEVQSAWAPALSEDLLVFVAPRDDNGGMNDVWVLPLDSAAP